MIVRIPCARSRIGSVMTIYGGTHLANSFRTVRKNTIQVAEDIPEEKYGFAAAEGSRPVGKMLTHIALATKISQDIHESKLTNLEGYDFFGLFDRLRAEEKKQRSKAEIVELLRSEGEKFAAFLEKLTPETLAEEVQDPGGNKKTRLERLMSAKEHEMHHRAQLMLMERMLGIVPHLTKQFEEIERQMRAAKGA